MHSPNQAVPIAITVKVAVSPAVTVAVVGCVAIEGDVALEGAGVLTEVAPPPQLTRVAPKSTEKKRVTNALKRIQMNSRSGIPRLRVDKTIANFLQSDEWVAALYLGERSRGQKLS